MWLKKPIPVSTVPSPEPSRLRDSLIFVSFVFRSISAVRIACFSGIILEFTPQIPLFFRHFDWRARIMYGQYVRV